MLAAAGLIEDGNPEKLPNLRTKLDFSGEEPTAIFECTSKFDPSIVLTTDHWAVTHLNTSPNNQFGHAIIIVEKLEAKEDNGLTIPLLCVGYYDITLPHSQNRTCSIFSARKAFIRAQEFSGYYPYLYQSNPSSKTYLREKASVNVMLSTINDQIGQDIPYHFSGNRTAISQLDKNHNCLTWTYEMLSLANILIKPPAIDRIAAIPSCYFK